MTTDPLKPIAQRIQALREIAGTAQLTSAPGAGTRIVLAVQLPAL